jgi:hypothetical protein
VNARSFLLTTGSALLVALLAPGAILAGGPTDGTDDWKGAGNVAETRCQGMARGPNCITPADRKAAAARAKAARDAADADRPAADAARTPEQSQ